jgi:tetratricopeptide (TPR) repeat protein
VTVTTIAYVLAVAVASGQPAGRGGAATIAPARYQELLLAGRFAEARALLHEVVRRDAAGRGTREGASTRSAEMAAREARAWGRLAEMDWRQPVDTASVPREREWSRLTAVELLEVGLVSARAAWPGGDPDRLAVAYVASEAIERRPGTESGLFHALVLAAIAAAQEERDVLALALVQARDLDRRLISVGHPLPASFSVPRLAGDLWLQVHRYEDARLAYRDAAQNDSRCARAWLGLARALARLGERAASAESYRAFLDLWQGADVDRPELDEARAALRASSP